MRDSLQELVDGEDTAARAHVESCPGCRTEFEALSAAAAAVAGLEDFEPSGGFEEAVMRRLRLRQGLVLAARWAAVALLATWAALLARFASAHAWGAASFLLDPRPHLLALELQAFRVFALARDSWAVLSAMGRIALGPGPAFMPLQWLAAACLAAASLQWVRTPGYRRSL